MTILNFGRNFRHALHDKFKFSWQRESTASFASVNHTEDSEISKSGALSWIVAMTSPRYPTPHPNSRTRLPLTCSTVTCGQTPYRGKRMATRNLGVFQATLPRRVRPARSLVQSFLVLLLYETPITLRGESRLEILNIVASSG